MRREKLQKIVIAVLMAFFFITPLKAIASDILDEVEKGNLAEVKKLIKENPELLEKRLKGGTSLLHYAVDSKSLEMVKFLVQKGAKINAKDNCGMTPLSRSVLNDQMEISKYLIDKGADVNISDSNGMNLLHHAVMKKNEKLVKLLVSKGADFRKKTHKSYGRLVVEEVTPLEMAAQNGSLEILKIILSNNKINAKEGDSLFRNALNEKKYEICDYLISSQAVGLKVLERQGTTPLCFAAGHRMYRTITFLIIRGMDVNGIDKYGDTPLLTAVNKQDLKAAKLLLSKGADPNLKDPLRLAVEIQNMKLTELLVNHKAKINPKLEHYIKPAKIYEIGFYSYINSEIINFLVSKGVEIDGGNRIFTYFLFGFAVRDGSFELINNLKAAGADIEEIITADLSNSFLCEATENGHLEMVKFLVERGADVNINSPLYFSILKKNYKTGRYLLKKGADVDGLTADGKSPLIGAIENKDIEAIKFLLSHKVNVNKKIKGGRYPLHFAARKGNVNIVRMLLSNGAEFRVIDNWGRHPVDYSYIWEVAEYFRNKGAYVYQTDEKGRTPLHWAALEGNVDEIKRLIQKKARINAKDDKGKTPLHLACQSNNFEAVEVLISNGSLILEEDEENKTPYSYALENGNQRIISLLKSKSGHLNRIEGFNARPIIRAVRQGKLEQVKWFINAGISPNTRFDERPLIHTAADNGRMEIVRFLLSKGVDPDVSEEQKSRPSIYQERDYDKRGSRLIHKAVRLGDDETVKLLIKLGADVNVKDSANVTPLVIALKNRNHDIVKILVLNGAVIDEDAFKTAVQDSDLKTLKFLELESGRLNKYLIDINSLLLISVLNRNSEISDYLLSKGADITVKDKKGKNSLHYAAMAGNAQLAELLIKKGLNVDEQDSDGMTPLMTALKFGKMRTAESLHNLWADLELKDSRGDNALIYAAKYGDTQLFKLFTEGPFDPNLTDSNGDSLLHTAVQKNDPELVRYLIIRGADVKTLDSDDYHLMQNPDKEQTEIAKILFKYNADVYVKDSYGTGGLHLAAQKDDVERIKYLVKLGLDVNEKNKFSETPLHFAAEANAAKAFKVLVELGADVNAVNSKNDTPLTIILKRGDKKMTKFVINLNPKDSFEEYKKRELFWESIDLDRSDITFRLLIHGVDFQKDEENEYCILKKLRDKKKFRAGRIIVTLRPAYALASYSALPLKEKIWDPGNLQIYFPLLAAIIFTISFLVVLFVRLKKGEF